MAILVAAAFAAALAMSPAPPADPPPTSDAAPAANPPDKTDVTDGITLEDMRAIVADAGGTVDSVKENDEGGPTLETSFPNDNHIWFAGIGCKGDGDARRCTEYEMGMIFKLKSAAEARRLAPKFQFKYIAAVAEDDDLNFTRMDFTYGGVTRGHIATQMKVMCQMSDDTISPVIWPSSDIK